ncbi:MAG: polyribonucleotide nucleotidyltransferase [Deltaproteobacteria bacterium]|nr:MAG: polyribonucleotide nucleotidyltransferase [Deltaproteobacteria bacterium]
MIRRDEIELAGRKLIIETGRMARQADGAAFVQYGDTAVLVAAMASKKRVEGLDYFPLMIEYRERTYAAGRIPGGFFKREGRPTEKETTSSRFIDRPLRPLFPKEFNYDTQVIASVFSADQENNPDLVGMIGASTALMISDIPFAGPIAGVRVGRIGEEFICNPTVSQLKESDLDLIVAGSKEAVVMVEGGAKMVTEEDILHAIIFGHNQLQAILDLQEVIREAVGKPKREVTPFPDDQALREAVEERSISPLKEVIGISSKLERKLRLDEILDSMMNELTTEEDEEKRKAINRYFEDVQKRLVRQLIREEGRRIDNRGLNEIREVTCEIGVLPRTHGSALFTRGETQALSVVTLGTAEDEQIIEALEGESTKTFMLHYNFPPYSVGEVKPIRGPGRREIGHGVMAEKALLPVVPIKDSFPYTIRIVSDILESNGSSSMATVCGGTLALMDAGVPIKAPVAGIAMGLIKEEEEFYILSDILGDEDHLGDMDFKVAGSREGITVLQMDIKIPGVNEEILRRALIQAKEARIEILDKMLATIEAPRPELSVYAPRIVTIYVKPERIKDVIGPGGKIIKGIIERTGVKIDIDDTGKVDIASADSEAMEKAIDLVKKLVQEVEIGKLYMGKVKKITEFGAFVEIFPGTEGLVHISQLTNEYVRRVQDIVKEGEEIVVKVLDVDPQGKIRLSRKEALGKNMDGQLTAS